jgi:hypothetical protein
VESSSLCVEGGDVVYIEARARGASGVGGEAFGATGGCRGGRGTSCQVLLSTRAWYSSIIAVRQLASASALR